jgi:hypothetical protein
VNRIISVLTVGPPLATWVFAVAAIVVAACSSSGSNPGY